MHNICAQCYPYRLTQVVLEETGWEERLWNDLFCVMWDVKSLLVYVSLLSFILSTADFHCEFTRDLVTVSVRSTQVIKLISRDQHL